MSERDADRAARARVEADLAAAIALEAGAGTGKTTALVARVVALLRAGTPLRRLVIVTFLRAAAEEMRVRLRARLAEEEGAWARQAEADLAGAAIGTIHSFAQRLLAQEAEAAAWDPGTRVLEEDEAEALERHHFRAWLGEAAAADPEPMLGLRRLGQAPAAHALLALAGRLTPDAALPDLPPPPAAADADAFERRVADTLGTFDRLAPACRVPTDGALATGPRLRAALAELALWRGEERVAAACRLRLPAPRDGNKKNWRPDVALAELKAALADLGAAQDALRAQAGAYAATALLRWLAPYPAFAAARRRALGVATFDDLLRRAVDLLAADEAARGRTAARYDALLVDEFQDTDPLQARLLSLIAGAPGHAGPGGRARLFVVGDPKQAIYRFRGADIDTYLAFTGAFPADGRLPLVDNHRARTPLLDLPNRVCAPLMAEGSVPYRALVGGRGAPPAGAPAPVQVLRGRPGEAPRDIADSRQIEAAWVAAFTRAALDTWRLAGGRPLRPGDVALLFRTRTAYAFYAEALERWAVPVAAERDRGLWQVGVARDAARLLLAIAQPHSPLAVAAALRTALVGASDDDMWRFVRAGGRFDLEAVPPPGAPERLGRALEALGAQARARTERPSRRLQALVEHLDLAGAAVLAEGERGARSLAQVIETVRLLEARRPGGLGALADVAAALSGVGAPAIEDEALPYPAPAADPPPEGGAVRLLTVHEAKGNQFPVVVLCDVWGGPPPVRAHLYASPRDGRIALSLSAPWQEPPIASPGADALREADRAAAEGERVRLLYVALTRAQEVIVLPDPPVKQAAADSVAGLLGRAAGLGKGAGVADALGALGVDFVEADAPEPVSAPLPRLDAARLAGHDPDLLALRQRLGRQADAVPIVRPSGAEGDGTLAAVEAVSGPWPDRERARRVGLAVHAVFAQAVSTAGAPDVAALAARAALAEDLAPGDADEVAALARAALAHPLAERARRAPRCTVEAALSARTGSGAIILGRADLVFGDGETAVVVDLKTDRLPAPTEGAAAAHAQARGYDRQLGLYAYALASAAGLRVREAWVLYARGGMAVEVPRTAPADQPPTTAAPPA